MDYTSIIMDKKTYRLRVKADTWTESFRLKDGRNRGELMSGKTSRDIKGTYYDFRLDIEPDPQYMDDYKAFWNAISAPVEAHEVTMPSINGPLTHMAMVSDGGHTLRDFVNGQRQYKNLTIFFEAQSPDRLPD